MKSKQCIECWVPWCILGNFGKYKILFNPAFIKHHYYKRGEVETMDGHIYEIVKENKNIKKINENK